jgi:hypothetical protein
MGKLLRMFTIGLVCALTLAGCLCQETTMVVRYDAKEDVFTIFTVYEHFRSTRTGTNVKATERPLAPDDYAAADFGRLKELWDARDRMIPAYILPFSFDGPARIELSDDHKRLKDVDVRGGDPEISWDKVQIIPGRLFEDRDGLVGYWHEVRIPGSVVDELLHLARVRLGKNEQLLVALDGELERRKTQKGVGRWREFSDWLKAQGDRGLAGQKDEGDNSEEFQRRLLGCLQERSLAELRRVVGGGELDLSRHGSVLRLRLGVTRRDAEGMIAVLRQMNDYLVQREKRTPDAKETERFVFLLREVIAAAGAMSADESGCSFSLDMVPAFNRFYGAARQEGAKLFAADANAKIDAKAMAKLVEGWQGDALVKGADVEKLLAEFNSRRELSPK